MPDVPDRRNLAGCTIMTSVIALFLFFCLYVGLSSKTTEILISDVQDLGASLYALGAGAN